MTLLLDAGPLVALADPAEPQRATILEILTTETGALVIPVPTTAEVDYLLGRRFGSPARRAFLSDLAAGRFSVASLERADYVTVIDLDARYADLDLGLADCTLVCLAARHRTTRILTFDERHFRTVAPLHGETFTLLPRTAECALDRCEAQRPSKFPSSAHAAGKLSPPSNSPANAWIPGAGLRLVIVGGLGVKDWGHVRGTQDVDLVPDPNNANPSVPAGPASLESSCAILARDGTCFLPSRTPS